MGLRYIMSKKQSKLRISFDGKCPECSKFGQNAILNICTNSGATRNMNIMKCTCGCVYVNREQLDKNNNYNEKIENKEYFQELSRIYSQNKNRRKKKKDKSKMCSKCGRGERIIGTTLCWEGLKYEREMMFD